MVLGIHRPNSMSKKVITSGLLELGLLIATVHLGDRLRRPLVRLHLA
jgi:DMSO reductase anchor subunit